MGGKSSAPLLLKVRRAQPFSTWFLWLYYILCYLNFVLDGSYLVCYVSPTDIDTRVDFHFFRWKILGGVQVMCNVPFLMLRQGREATF